MSILSSNVTVSKSSYIGNPSPAPPNDVSFYSVEMDNGGRGYMSYDGNPSPAPPVISDPSGGPYYPTSMGSTGHIMGGHLVGTGTGTLTRTRTLPRPVPPPDVTVMTAGTKSPIPPSVPPPPATFARVGANNGGPHSHPHSHAAPPPPPCQSHPLSTFAATPSYSDIDGHLVWGSPIFGPSSVRGKYRAVAQDDDEDRRPIAVTERSTRLWMTRSVDDGFSSKSFASLKSSSIISMSDDERADGLKVLALIIICAWTISEDSVWCRRTKVCK